VRPTPFQLPFGDHVLRGDTYAADCSTLVLHGAGGSCRDRFTPLRDALNDRGMPSVSFDFIGHGETGGALLGSSLRERTQQAAAVIRHACHEPLTIVGASMSAYTAIRLTEMFTVENLVLLVPAVYTAGAYRVPFGPDFSAAIRVPGSWRGSDAYSILSRFTGNLLVIAADCDQVIPHGLVELVRDSAEGAKVRHLHVVPGAGHVGLFADEHEFVRALDLIEHVCRDGRSHGAGLSYRLMTAAELPKLADIDRSERVRTGYEMRDGELVAVDVDWDVPSFFKEGDGEHSLAEQLAFCRGHLAAGAVMIGAFDREVLAGIGILTPEIRPGVAQLAYLYVSSRYRRTGVASTIVARLTETARGLGTRRVYVSATPSESAVGFYRSLGFAPVAEPFRELLALEPEDIHMILPLRHTAAGT
jgi:pimeloyl-ACP methyl ester carboxylesterase/GNAT superfamily N-acetyltransferase